MTKLKKSEFNLDENYDIKQMLSKKSRTRPIWQFSYHYLTLSQISQSLYGGMNQREFTPTTTTIPSQTQNSSASCYYYIYLFTAVCLFALLYVPTYNIIPVTYVCINLKSLDHTRKNSDYCLQFTIICKSNFQMKGNQ